MDRFGLSWKRGEGGKDRVKEDGDGSGGSGSEGEVGRRGKEFKGTKVFRKYDCPLSPEWLSKLHQEEVEQEEENGRDEEESNGQDGEDVKTKGVERSVTFTGSKTYHFNPSSTLECRKRAPSLNMKGSLPIDNKPLNIIVTNQQQEKGLSSSLRARSFTTGGGVTSFTPPPCIPPPQTSNFHPPPHHHRSRSVASSTSLEQSTPPSTSTTSSHNEKPLMSAIATLKTTKPRYHTPPPRLPPFSQSFSVEGISSLADPPLLKRDNSVPNLDEEGEGEETLPLADISPAQGRKTTTQSKLQNDCT